TPDLKPKSLFRLNVLGALREAIESREPWIVPTSTGEDMPDGLRGLIVDLRPAAQWLLSNPLRCDLVPPDLRAYLESISPSEPEVPSRQTRPGPISVASKIREAATRLKTVPKDFRSFKEYRRELLQVAGVSDQARGWSEDNIRRALRSK